MADITQDINYDKVVWEQLRRWRVARAPLLADLDIQWIRAMETNNIEEVEEIIEKKNQLRNITNYDFSGVNTLDDILKVWPSILGVQPDEFKEHLK